MRVYLWAVTNTFRVLVVGETASSICPAELELSGPAECELVHVTDISHALSHLESEPFDGVYLADPTSFGDVSHSTVVNASDDDSETEQLDQHPRERQLERQRQQITRLHDVGIEIAACEDRQSVYELVVDAAEDILDLDICLVDSVENGRLLTQATSSELTEYQEPHVDSPEAGMAGKAHRNNQSYLTTDAQSDPDAAPAGELRSGMSVPVGEYGVFQAASSDVGAFEESDLELVEILASHAREALTRIEQQQRLCEQRDQLQRENERLDEFASIVSHDLRNPLNVAQLRLRLLADEFDSEHVTPAVTALDQMEELVDDMLTLARDGQTVSEFTPVDLRRIVEESWDMVETRDATIDVETNARILGDEGRLGQLFGNLIRNAIEHTPDTDSLEVRVDVLDDETESGFYVADNGPGIPDSIADSLFQPGVSTNENGTGLGLAIVSRIVEAHGWNLRATESESGGARFEVTGVEFSDE